MTMCSRILKRWDVNDVFNDATAWMDCEMTCDLTESMWIVSPCHECKKKAEKNTKTQTNARRCTKKAQQVRRNQALTSTSTLWVNRPDSHKFMPETL